MVPVAQGALRQLLSWQRGAQDSLNGCVEGEALKGEQQERQSNKRVEEGEPLKPSMVDHTTFSDITS